MLVAATGGTAHAANTSLTAAPHVGVVVVGNESEEDALTAAASVSGANHKSVIALIDAWTVRIRGGQTVQLRSISQGAAVATQLSRLAALRRRIELTPVDTTSTPAKQITPLVNGNDPNSFAVRGYPGSGNLYWTGMQLANAYHECGPDGCGPDTDRYTCNTTINPGAYSSSVSWNCLYFPSSGEFQNEHFEMFAINHGNIVNLIQPFNQLAGPSGVTNPSMVNKIQLNGTVITVAITLWTYVTAYDDYVADGAKTADATCHSLPDNSCVY
jgi:hypothetical protein